MTVTDPGLPPQQGMSMFLVPADAPGLTVVRDIGLGGEPLGHGHHGLVHYDKVRLPADALLGEVGEGFAVAQTRLGGGRIHHAMRAVGVSNRVFEMMTERAVSRTTKGSLLGEKGAVEAFIADSYVQIQQFRLLVLHAAWTIDEGGLSAARREIAAVKIAAPQVLHDVVMRGIQLHGALGISNELPLWHFLKQVFVVGFSDGPAEVHRRSLTRSLLKDATPVSTVWPSEHIPTRLGLVPDEVRASLERHVGNL
jgi:acyl-CoA dehydrogenase